MNRVARQYAVVSLTALGLALLVRVFNHHLAPLHLSLNVGGLLITLAALRLHPKAALASAFTIGLGLDAVSPVPFGQNALLLLTACCLVIGVRHRIPREELPVGIAVAVVINLFLLIARTLAFADAWPDPAAGWLRVFSDLVASQVFVVLIAPWFFSLQRHSLVWLGADSVQTTANRYG
ncbi:MAG: hypothetical protein ABII82_05135 [Verrucomicrobiota bacterium]